MAEQSKIDDVEEVSEQRARPPASGELQPLRSVHTSSFPPVLRQLNLSVMVTTYQAGRLVLLRADGELLNTHFRCFNKPMGLAVKGGRLAVGCAIDIWEFHNMPAVAGKLEPAGKHDACFMPRRSHSTGNVQIHEMGWGATDAAGPNSVRSEAKSEPVPELWFVNTTFSCLSTRNDEYSFDPRWRPSFVSALAPGDRCHLNGLAIVDGRPRYVTALGETDTPGGWRENKRDGGILIDVDSGEIITRGLSMPHSPRWYGDQLWVLESGNGGIGKIDLATGRYEEIAQFPGFTRGLTFCGPLAFIGLSQVRESAVFSGIPLVDRLEERTCGVWVLNIHTGETVAFVKFEDAVQEIFAVELLPGMRFPDLINDDMTLLSSSFTLPDEALRDVPREIRSDTDAR